MISKFILISIHNGNRKDPPPFPESTWTEIGNFSAGPCPGAAANCNSLPLPHVTTRSTPAPGPEPAGDPSIILQLRTYHYLVITP